MGHNTPVFDRHFYGQGQIILREGDEGGTAYLIQSGEVLVFAEKDGEEVELARLYTGDIVGEMALISDGERTANVKAAKDTTLITISRQQFEDKLRESDPTIRAMIHMLARRMINANNTVLDRKADTQDLKRTAQAIYDNIHEELPAAQKLAFHNKVAPHLKWFIEAIEGFEDRYNDPVA